MWSAERIALLRKLWAEGLSASQIAKQLTGVTRNAVIGKVHRLGLAGRATPSRPAKTRRAICRGTRPRVFVLPRPVPPAPPAFLPPLLFSVFQLNDATCRYPVGDPKSETFGFCGRGRSRGAYCCDHARLTYQPHGEAKADALAVAA